MEVIITSYLLAVMAAITHLLVASAILEVVVRALRGEKQIPKHVPVTYVLVLAIWWAVFFLLLWVIR